MSELTNTNGRRTDLRLRLLVTASAITLLGFTPAGAADNDSGRSPLWIELGGQFATEENQQDAYLPPFLLATPRPPVATLSPGGFQKPPPSSWDGTAKITYEPSGTDWTFSVGVLYGRSSRSKSVYRQTTNPDHGSPGGFDAYQNLQARNSESHTIVDFRAGKDVGLGMFGSGGSSVVSVGVRYAQFNASSTTGIQSQPTNVGYGSGAYHIFDGSFSAERKFSGVGPSLSWDASANLIDNPSAGSISIDWAVTGAMLFGRQQLLAHHKTTDAYKHRTNYTSVFRTATQTGAPSRRKNVTVPNLGGFMGVSWRYPNGTVTLGYRADFFFGAMDGGIDAAKRENVGFYGPFASIAVGL
jgi:iron complex outermembrane receptor protein